MFAIMGGILSSDIPIARNRQSSAPLKYKLISFISYKESVEVDGVSCHWSRSLFPRATTILLRTEGERYVLAFLFQLVVRVEEGGNRGERAFCLAPIGLSSFDMDIRGLPVVEGDTSDSSSSLLLLLLCFSESSVSFSVLFSPIFRKGKFIRLMRLPE